MAQKSLFWADQIAREIATRKSSHYIKKDIPSFKKFVVKTSASISGVLHIGRLSDTIRGDSVVRALLDRGDKTEFIWVAEDMDPLRKVPKGVPRKFEGYIGMPVTDIPDPFGCHKTYAEHHTAKYFEVLGEFISSPMKRYSARAEYRKGSFRPFIKKILDNIDKVIEIQNKYRSSPLPGGWSPWKPVCEKCGKIITTSVIGFEGGKARYVCNDYSFENTRAKGCGHKGENDPLKGKGKLVWKSEWAAEWALWKVSSEGAGKEYQVPNSAWWVNGEIAERVLDFPMPVPIFYEHLMIEGEKMSASKGNVVYPEDWLKVAPPELLRFFYNKKLMKTRSFSWRDLPSVYDDYDKHESVFFGKARVGNKKEKEHMKRLFCMSQIGKPAEGIRLPFDFAAMLAQTSGDTKHALDVLERTEHIKGKPGKRDLERIESRMDYAKAWIETYAPEEQRIRLSEKPSNEITRKLSPEQKEALKELRMGLEKKALSENELYSMFWEISKKHGLPAPKFFEACYLVLLGKPRGPRLSSFIMAVGREKVAALLRKSG